MIEKAISEKQPWGYLLCAGIKNIENRTWKLPEKYKGERVLIHASARVAKFRINHNQFMEIEHAHLGETFGKITGLIKDPNFNMNYHFGAIIGSVRFMDCVVNHDSIWAEKTPEFEKYDSAKDYRYHYGEPVRYNWVVGDPVLFKRPILNVKGRLSFWDVPNEIMKQIKDNNEILDYNGRPVNG